MEPNAASDKEADQPAWRRNQLNAKSQDSDRAAEINRKLEAEGIPLEPKEEEVKSESESGGELESYSDSESSDPD